MESGASDALMGLIYQVVEPMLYILLIPIIWMVVKLAWLMWSFSRSGYSAMSGNSYMKTYFDTGAYGEYLTFRLLEKLPGTKRALVNVYLPKEGGDTTEIDVLLIAPSGMYVFESKNYSGWIFGNEKNRMWTQSLPGGRKYKFFNPIWQNKLHTKALGQFLGLNEDTLHSYIVFSQRCDLKKVTVTSPEITVLKRETLRRRLARDLRERPVVFTDEDIERYYQALKARTGASDAVKEQHIAAIKEKH